MNDIRSCCNCIHEAVCIKKAQTGESAKRIVKMVRTTRCKETGIEELVVCADSISEQEDQLVAMFCVFYKKEGE